MRARTIEAQGGEAGCADEPQERPRERRKTGKDIAPQVVPLPSASLRTLRRTSRTAHAVFLDASSLARPRSWPVDASVPFGLAHYRALHDSLRAPLDVVKTHLESWMELFEWSRRRKKREGKYHMGEAVVDEDGFTLVTCGGTYGKTLGGGVGVASKKIQDEQQGKGSGKRNRKKRDTKEKDAFYGFQIHEKKRQGEGAFLFTARKMLTCMP